MGFLDELAAALNENAAFFGAETASGIGGEAFVPGALSSLQDLSGLPDATDFGGFEGFTPGSAEEINWLEDQLWVDATNPTGPPLTTEQARAADPDEFQQSLAALRGSANTPAAPAPAKGFLERLAENPAQMIGLGIVGAAGLGGLATAITGMVRNSSGGGTVTLPSGRAIQLSPQETQLLDLAVSQAKDQSDIARLALPILAKTLDERGAADVLAMLQQGVSTAATQAGTQGAVARAAGEGVSAFAPGVYARDLANESRLQGVQGQAILNLGDIMASGPTPGEALWTEVGTAADTRAKGLITGTTPVDPTMANLYNLADVSRGGVLDYLGGRLPVPAAYRGLDATRGMAEDQVQAALRGDVAVNPQLARLIQEQLEALHGRLQVELGPGYATSTPGMRALRDFETWAREQIVNDNRVQMGAANAIAMPRASFLEDQARARTATASPFVAGVPQLAGNLRNAELSTLSPIALGRLSFGTGAQQQRFGQAATVAGQPARASNAIGTIFTQGQTGGPSPAGTVSTLLGERPGNIALQGIGALSPIGTAQAGAALSVQQQNALLEFLRNQGLVQGGGNLVGMAASPFLDVLARSLVKG